MSRAILYALDMAHSSIVMYYGSGIWQGLQNGAALTAEAYGYKYCAGRWKAARHTLTASTVRQRYECDIESSAGVQMRYCR